MARLQSKQQLGLVFSLREFQDKAWKIAIENHYSENHYAEPKFRDLMCFISVTSSTGIPFSTKLYYQEARGLQINEKLARIFLNKQLVNDGFIKKIKFGKGGDGRGWILAATPKLIEIIKVYAGNFEAAFICHVLPMFKGVSMQTIKCDELPIPLKTHKSLELFKAIENSLGNDPQGLFRENE